MSEHMCVERVLSGVWYVNTKIANRSCNVASVMRPKNVERCEAHSYNKLIELHNVAIKLVLLGRHFSRQAVKVQRF